MFTHIFPSETYQLSFSLILYHFDVLL